MSSDPVSICNQALGWLGASLILSLDDDTPEAILCKANYENLSRSVQEERVWSFAAKRFTMEAPIPDEWGNGFKYLIPGDVSVLYRVYQEPQGPTPLPNWVVESGYLRAQDWEGKLFCKGIAPTTNNDLFTNTFIQCLAARLASDLAIPITKNRQLQMDMWKLYNDKLQEAGSVDGQQGSNERFSGSELVGVRRI
jgi:hypothetical protein